MTIFRTADFGLTAFAICEGARLIEISRDEPRRAVFILEGDLDEQELKEKFWNGGTVEVAKFIEAQREVKKRLFSDAF